MSQPHGLIRTLLFILALQPSCALQEMHHMKRFAQPLDLENRQTRNTPLVVSNQCAETIYPGILTQGGSGPGTGGFELTPGTSRTMTVSENWQGRVWGRTNCTFNGGSSGSCSTGDCGGVVNCVNTGAVPTTLAEFTLDAGDGHTYYDLSLVDGYNLPVAVVLQTNGNSSFNNLPGYLTNPSCVGSVGDLQPPGYNPYSGGQSFLGTTGSNPLPFDNTTTLSDAAQWCPYNLQVSTSTGPNGGVYTYPDGTLNRAYFDPCYSACSKWNLPQDCCTGQYDSPSACKPSSYSQSAKSVCPDAYSYAYDDQTSTFIIPAGAGFEVIFCPGARSTNILATSRQQLNSLAQTMTHSKRQTQPEMNTISQLQTAVNSVQHVSSGSKPATKRAILALIAVAAFAITFL